MIVEDERKHSIIISNRFFPASLVNAGIALGLYAYFLSLRNPFYELFNTFVQYQHAIFLYFTILSFSYLFLAISFVLFTLGLTTTQIARRLPLLNLVSLSQQISLTIAIISGSVLQLFYLHSTSLLGQLFFPVFNFILGVTSGTHAMDLLSFAMLGIFICSYRVFSNSLLKTIRATSVVLMPLGIEIHYSIPVWDNQHAISTNYNLFLFQLDQITNLDLLYLSIAAFILTTLLILLLRRLETRVV